MSSSDSTNDNDNDNDVSLDPATPRKSTTMKKEKGKSKDATADEDVKGEEEGGSDDPVTPAKKGPSPLDTPKSAPAGATHQRQRSNTKKMTEPPTLLADFLMGRPSPARLAAQRQRRMSVEAVKAELRHEMKQSAVRKVQPPNSVRDRVKKWQKANAADEFEDTPDDARTEPTDIAFNDEDGVESVTEEDRIRIKMRQRRRPPRSSKPVIHKAEDTKSKPDEDGIETDGSQPPPKKRVISDDHWMKTKNRRSPHRRVSPRSKRSSPSSGGGQIPKDFTTRTAANPNVKSRVKDWADKVETPDTTPPRSYRSSKSRGQSILSEDGTEVLSEGGYSSGATAKQSLRHKQPGSGGSGTLRIKPVRKKKLSDVGPGNTSASDLSSAATSQTASTNLTRRRSKTLPTSKRPNMVFDRIEVIEDRSELTQTTGLSTDLTTSTGTDGIEVIEEPESVIDTPTKRKTVESRPNTKERPQSYHPGGRKTKDDDSWIDDGSNIGDSQLLGSDLASSLANKSVADIPGEIPWGHSAFSELDLPLKGPARSRPKQPKVDRSTSLKGMPSVFKKVVQESKKIISEMNEPPRPVGTNKPPSIEKWLTQTVDPFVDESKDEEKPHTEMSRRDSNETAPEPRKHASSESPKEILKSHDRPTPLSNRHSSPVTNYRKEKVQRKASYESKTSRHSRSKSETVLSEETSAITDETIETTPKASQSSSRTPDSDGLKRRRAVRSTSSPSKPVRNPLLGMLKEAFQGESSDYRKSSFTYQGQEELIDNDDMSDERTMSGYDTKSSYLYDETPTGSELSSDMSAEPAPRMAGPRLRPPTNGNHELSTIMSEEGSSAIDSDMTSDVSRSTLTQSTVLTKDSDLSRSRSKSHEPGLKRRLTKHSDLVSVLSLPDDSDIPNTIKSTRSRPSLRKNRGNGDHVTTDELLREFSDDEGLYMRELKTLVDGVVPVLLSQVVRDGNPVDLFGVANSGQQISSMSKSVVGMGIALEKLKNAHQKAPHNDIRRLAHWAHGVVPIYNSYLNSWRLGFQDLIVNLAPAAGVPEDEDSLLNAMPRNESGDVVNSNGERIDVAHLLKRPLIRIKHLVKFIKCVDSMYPSEDTYELLKNFQDLQDKSRRRHREETARLIDEEATNTDTTRSRDVRTLFAIDDIWIDPSRQVNAKDVFSLDLAHSNGQRLECQVELIYRDNQKDPSDPGDLLIREMGEGHRSYLLFPPLTSSAISARTGEGNFDMVVMIRGIHNGRQWHELLTFTSDNEDQILDWLDILPVTPVPPREPEPSVVGDDDDEEFAPKAVDIPVGARSFRRKGTKPPRTKPSPPQSPSTPPRALPSRYHPRKVSQPSTPPRIEEELDSHLEKTPTQDDYTPRNYDSDLNRPLNESMRPDPLKLGKRSSPTPYRDDGAPPPPAHRSVTPTQELETEQPKSTVKPPVELKSDGKVRRRTSSPLKHEYLPSDEASASDRTASSESGSEYSDSDDELDILDVPETELGVSINHDEPIHRPVPAAHEPTSASECSLTPSNSASQAGLYGPKMEENKDEAVRYMATLSRWSDKGTWKDIINTPCSIVVTPGLIEAYPFQPSNPDQNQTSGRPLLAMDLTPLVLIRQSTAVDLEIRSSIQTHCSLYESYSGGNFRFRCFNGPDCYNLYMAVHHSRLNNQKFIQLENEARFRSFGEREKPVDNDDHDDTSSRRRSWFGRKNSYRSSVRAPSQSQDGASTNASSSVSASSFLKRLTVAGNLTFNLARSSVDKQSRPGSSARGNSLYTSGSSSSGTPPRSPSISVENSGHSPATLDSENIRIRLHLLVSAAKWEDCGNCILQIRRPPPGWHQALRADHGLEKRVTVTTLPKKTTEAPKIMLDAVLGSGCFQPMGSRGIVCGVWEEVKDGDGVVGMVPKNGPTGGNIKKWCFQCASVAEASWVLRLVHQEVFRV